jgi:hypothetical protein
MQDRVPREAILFTVTLPRIQAPDRGTISSRQLESHSPLRVRKWGWPQPWQLTLAPNHKLHNPWEGWGVLLGSFGGNCAHRWVGNIIIVFLTSYLTYQFNIASSSQPPSLDFMVHPTSIQPKSTNKNKNDAVQYHVLVSFASWKECEGLRQHPTHGVPNSTNFNVQLGARVNMNLKLLTTR